VTHDVEGSIVVTSRSFGSGRTDPSDALRRAGYQVVRADHRHEPDALAGSLATAVAWIAGTGPIGRTQLELAPQLRIIARYGVGTDGIDRQELSRRGIVLTNTPGANTGSVADHTLGLMLALLRGTLLGDRSVREGAPPPPPGRELGECTVALVGAGAIGRAVLQRLSAFGARVVVHDPYVDPASLPDVELLELDQLAAVADVVSLHRPHADAPIIDEPFLDRLSPGAVLVNTARASLVDEAAVAAALTTGRLAGAALDVHSAERSGSSPLLSAPNVILTPHLSGHTLEAIDRMGRTAADEVLRVLRGEPPRHAVLLPEPEPQSQ
jgi:D-3-phosphoglycerate dehydrogenase / 2-oxoglutarate reductase